MVILIQKQTILMLCCCVVVGFSAFLWMSFYPTETIPVFAAQGDLQVTVIVDPGHGGEDGGAVSADGVKESQINLAVSLQVNDLLRFAGQKTMMTRSEDISIHTEGETIRSRKASDIRNRVALVNGTENAVLLSIHQNSLPSSTITRGAQVFWNTADGAENLAKVVQDSLNTSINPENEKQPKQISSTIYLMKHTTAPAILVECGFLSNPAETMQLQDASYQRKLSVAISAGYLRCLSGEEVS